MTRDEAINWIKEGIDRLVTDIECSRDHFANEEYDQAAIHLSQLANYCTLTGQTIMQNLLSFEEAAEVIRQLLETNKGIPMEKIEVAPGMFAYQEQEVIMPDSLDGIDGMDEG